MLSSDSSKKDSLVGKHYGTIKNVHKNCGNFSLPQFLYPHLSVAEWKKEVYLDVIGTRKSMYFRSRIFGKNVFDKRTEICYTMILISGNNIKISYKPKKEREKEWVRLLATVLPLTMCF